MQTPAPPEVHVELTHEVIDAATLIASVADPQAGAIGVFLGVVRAEARAADRVRLVGLEYSAYESMARAELETLSRAAAAEFGLLRVRVAHRLGRLRVGEASVAVVASSAHRAESFAGCRAIIDRLKQSVPIFKQEIWDDGAATWVDPG